MKTKHVIYQIEKREKRSHLVPTLPPGDVLIEKCRSDVDRRQSESKLTVTKLGELYIKLKISMNRVSWYHFHLRVTSENEKKNKK